MAPVPTEWRGLEFGRAPRRLKPIEKEPGIAALKRCATQVPCCTDREAKLLTAKIAKNLRKDRKEVPRKSQRTCAKIAKNVCDDRREGRYDLREEGRSA